LGGGGGGRGQIQTFFGKKATAERRGFFGAAILKKLESGEVQQHEAKRGVVGPPQKLTEERALGELRTVKHLPPSERCHGTDNSLRPDWVQKIGAPTKSLWKNLKASRGGERTGKMDGLTRSEDERPKDMERGRGLRNPRQQVGMLRGKGVKETKKSAGHTVQDGSRQQKKAKVFQRKRWPRQGAKGGS